MRFHPRTMLFLMLALPTLAGCLSLRVEMRKDADVLDSLNASLGTSGLSERSLATLRADGLDVSWRSDPAKTVELLFRTTVDEPSADRLFALSEMHHQMAKARRIKPDEALRHHYLCAGFAHHYLLYASGVAATKDDKRPTLAPADAFDPRFRLACDLYNLQGVGPAEEHEGQPPGRLRPN
jgi:hypothetical protein